MKTYKEIINYHRKVLVDLKAPNCDGTYDDSELVRDAIIYNELVIAACEKQVAKKPNVKELPDAFGRLYWNVCGACDEEIESDYDYCPDCGQKIDWSEQP